MNNHILNKDFITKLVSIKHRNSVCAKIYTLPRNVYIVQVLLLFRNQFCMETFM